MKQSTRYFGIALSLFFSLSLWVTGSAFVSVEAIAAGLTQPTPIPSSQVKTQNAVAVNVERTGPI